MIKKELLIGIFVITGFLYFNCYLYKKIEKMSTTKDNQILKLKKSIKKQNKIIEKFTDNEEESETKENLEDLIEKKISKIYKVDLEAIRNLSIVSKKLGSKDGYTLPGNIVIDGKLKLGGSFNYLPKGSIIAFNGEKAPSGWAICDGKNGTPDLKGKFIYGSGNGNVVGNKGGKDKVTLTTPEMPRHNHGAAGVHSHKTIRNFEYEGKCFGQGNNAFSWGGGGARIGTGGPCFRTSNDGNHTHRNEGEGKPFSIMPPYVVLMYIMKL